MPKTIEYDTRMNLERRVAALEAITAEAKKSSQRSEVGSSRWMERIAELEEVVEKYRKAIDDIYNHNEAARAAVIAHFGLHHPPAAMRSIKQIGGNP